MFVQHIVVLTRRAWWVVEWMRRVQMVQHSVVLTRRAWWVVEWMRRVQMVQHSVAEGAGITS